MASTELAWRLWRWMKRQAAIEPGIGHLKQEHRMDRCRLWGAQGDAFNAVLSAAGMNFRKRLAHAAVFLRLWPALSGGFFRIGYTTLAHVKRSEYTGRKPVSGLLNPLAVYFYPSLLMKNMCMRLIINDL